MDTTNSRKMMVIFPILGGVAIGAFSIIRFMSGDVLAGSFDLLISVAFFASSFYTYLTGRDTASRYICALLSVVGPLVVLKLLGHVGIYWVYSSTVVLFFLLPYRYAIALNLITLTGVAVIFWGLENNPVELFSFVVTISLINLFSFLFSLNEDRSKKQLQILSVRDDLTGIGNRRAFMARINETINLHKRYKRMACLVYLDIDRFKTINDTLGHALGDHAISTLASFIKSMLRETDNVYRIGGDEFVILVDGIDKETALQLTEKIRQSVESKKILSNQVLTISLGVALVREDDSADSWIARADLALYKAKQAGRNQVMLEAEQPASVPA